jgi:hypothetical protein
MAFHEWKEFSGFNVSKSKLQLAGSASVSRITLFIKPAEMDNVLKYVERHVKVQSSNLSIEGE